MSYKYLPVNSSQLEKVRQQLLNVQTNVGSCDNFKCPYHAPNSKRCIADKDQLEIKGCFRGLKQKKIDGEKLNSDYQKDII